MLEYKSIEFYDRFGQDPETGFASFSEEGGHFFTFNQKGTASLISGSYPSADDRDAAVSAVTEAIKRRDNFKIVKKGLANYNLVLHDSNKNELCVSRNYTSAIQANEVLFSFFELPKIDLPTNPYSKTEKVVSKDPEITPVDSEDATAADNKESIPAPDDFKYKSEKATIAKEANGDKRASFGVDEKTLERRQSLIEESKSERSYLPLLLLALIPIVALLLYMRGGWSGNSTEATQSKKETKKNIVQNKAAESKKAISGGIKKIENNVKTTASSATKKVVNTANNFKKITEKSTSNAKDKAKKAKEDVKRDAWGYEVGSVESYIYKCVKDPNCYPGKIYYWGEPKFKNNSAKINPDANSSIINIGNMMMKNPNMRITIRGNSLVSEDEYATNESLSDQRANAMKNLLKAKGVPEDRITAYGNGQGNSINFKTGSKADHQNKRLDIILDSK